MNEATGTGDPPRAGNAGNAAPVGKIYTPEALMPYALKALPILIARGASADEAEEALGDTMAKMVEMSAAGRLPHMTNPGGYLYRTARNMLVSNWRETNREVPVGENWDVWSSAAKEYDQYGEPEDRGGRTLGDIVEILKPYLTAAQFRAFYLTYALEMEEEEVAAEMDIKLRTVRSHLSQARKRLEGHRRNLYGDLDL